VKGICYCTVAVLLAVSSGFAQTPAGRRAGLATVLQLSYAGIKADLTAAAEKMPSDDYALKPGPSPEVRTFGALMAHVAAGQYGTCAAVRSVPSPVAGKKLEQVYLRLKGIVPPSTERQALPRKEAP
jgi:hypothetical protein